jgi:hypothetical protein
MLTLERITENLAKGKPEIFVTWVKPDRQCKILKS